MTVGDVVNGMSATGTALTYQPAGTIEVLISTIAFNDNAKRPQLTNGTNTSFISWSTTGGDPDPANLKIFINNTIYLRLDNLVAGEVTAFSGLQTK